MKKCAWCGMQVPDEDMSEHLDQHVEEMRKGGPIPPDEREVPQEEEYERGENGLG